MKHIRRRSTPPGGHVPVMAAEVLAALDPQPGSLVVDCTLGHGGHAALLLARGATVIGLDRDADQLERTRDRLPGAELHHANFAGLPGILAGRMADGVLADLGVSSMQIDDPGRGFSFSRDGDLDMRMDRSRGQTAAKLLATLSADELAQAFREFGDEPRAERVALAIVRHRGERPLTRTAELAELIRQAAPVTVEHGPNAPTPRQQQLRPVARVFQALRILVNRELANLTELLRVLPYVLSPGGRAAVISFHSGEDRLVKAAFRDGYRDKLYDRVSADAVRAGPGERYDNPRSRSAKLRWAARAVA